MGAWISQSKTRPRLALQSTPRLVALLSLVAGIAGPAWAHDPYEIWAMAVLRSDHLELGVTMAQSTALRLIDPQGVGGVISFENFATHRDRLLAEARKLYVLTAARRPLPPEKVAVELTDENDVVFTLRYARPAAGPLHFHAALLKKLGAGYGGILDVSQPGGAHLGWEQLSFENPNFEISLPAPSPRSK